MGSTGGEGKEVSSLSKWGSNNTMPTIRWILHRKPCTERKAGKYLQGLDGPQQPSCSSHPATLRATGSVIAAVLEREAE